MKAQGGCVANKEELLPQSGNLYVIRREANKSMAVYPRHQITINGEKKGLQAKGKPGFDLRYGKYSEIITPEHEFAFNLNGEIKFIKGRTMEWPHPFEQLKRTDGNDWVYYSCGKEGGERGVIFWLGEYYLPCLPYPNNSLDRAEYFSNPVVMKALGAWSMLFGTLYELQANGLQPGDKDLVERILAHDDNTLYQRSKRLRDIIGGRVSVLPPDTRHVDYEVVPLSISQGCLYHCGFCCVKSSNKFQVREKEDILVQIKSLKEFFGRNLENYRGLFLGDHDALAAGEEAISFAVKEAKEILDIGGNGAQQPLLFFFGSVGAFLKSKPTLMEALNRSGFRVYINLGFESVDPETLKFIKKPITREQVLEAFEKMHAVNSRYENVEITGNFLMGERLPQGHFPALEDLLKNAPGPSRGKGAVYLSPLKNRGEDEQLLDRYFDLKSISRLPVFVYLIQRL